MPKVKFLTDENVSPKIIRAMRTDGYDVKDIKEKKLFGVSDHQVLTLANKENRAIITYDKDFANLLNHPLQSHKGVVLLRYSELEPNNLIDKFLPLLALLIKRKLLGNLIIVSDDSVEIIEK